LLDLVLNKTITSNANDIESSNYKFTQAVLRLGDNPKKHISTILNILFNSKEPIINTVEKNMSKKLLNTLFSLWLNVYNIDGKYGFSICQGENDYPKKQIVIKDGLVYSDCISELVHRISEIHYLSV